MEYYNDNGTWKPVFDQYTKVGNQLNYTFDTPGTYTITAPEGTTAAKL